MTWIRNLLVALWGVTVLQWVHKRTARENCLRQSCSRKEMWCLACEYNRSSASTGEKVWQLGSDSGVLKWWWELVVVLFHFPHFSQRIRKYGPLAESDSWWQEELLRGLEVEKLQRSHWERVEVYGAHRGLKVFCTVRCFSTAFSCQGTSVEEAGSWV